MGNNNTFKFPIRKEHLSSIKRENITLTFVRYKLSKGILLIK